MIRSLVSRISAGHHLALLGLLAASALGSVACGGSQQRSSQAMQDDGVPANSASEARIEGDKPADKAAKNATASADPTQPYMQSVNGGSDPASPGGGGSGGKTSVSAKGGKGKNQGGGGNEAITPQECNQLFDKYVELTVLTDPRFDGIPPEMISQLKGQGMAQADKEKGNPCAKQAVTRTKYECAMAATHPKSWEGCMR